MMVMRVIADVHAQNACLLFLNRYQFSLHYLNINLSTNELKKKSKILR